MAFGYGLPHTNLYIGLNSVNLLPLQPIKHSPELSGRNCGQNSMVKYTDSHSPETEQPMVQLQLYL